MRLLLVELNQDSVTITSKFTSLPRTMTGELTEVRDRKRSTASDLGPSFRELRGQPQPCIEASLIQVGLAGAVTFPGTHVTSSGVLLLES